MNLYMCWYSNDEWCCYVIAKNRGRAKSIFHNYWNNYQTIEEYTDVRCKKIKEANGYEEGVHDIQDEVLDELGVKYLTEKEMEKYFDDFY